MLLVGWQEGYLACKKLSGGMLHGYMSRSKCICPVKTDLHTAQLMPLPPTISCSSKSRLVLPFWCWHTWVVPDNIQEGRKTVARVCVSRRNLPTSDSEAEYRDRPVTSSDGFSRSLGRSQSTQFWQRVISPLRWPNNCRTCFFSSSIYAVYTTTLQANQHTTNHMITQWPTGFSLVSAYPWQSDALLSTLVQKWNCNLN